MPSVMIVLLGGPVGAIHGTGVRDFYQRAAPLERHVLFTADQ